jgi:hypothetical protein
MPDDNAALSANTVDVQDLCGLGMDRAIGIEKKKASWFAPVGKLFKAAAQTIGFCMEMRRSWLSLLAPHASSHVGTAVSNSRCHSKLSPDELAYSMDIAIGPQHVAAPSSPAASSSVRKAQPQPTPDELAYSMDIAIGERFTAVPSSTVASNSDHQVPPPAEVPENNMEIAIGARAGG